MTVSQAMISVLSFALERFAEGARMTEKLLALMRSAIENDVTQALEEAAPQPPSSAPADILEFYHRMLDLLTRAGEAADAADRLRTPPGFGSTG